MLLYSDDLQYSYNFEVSRKTFYISSGHLKYKGGNVLLL